MANTSRSRTYSLSTLKILFARSGDQCAVPGCQQPIIQPTDEQYDDRVIGQICHIYALNPDGPRGNGGLSQDQLNSEPNLILLCPTHHQEIDNDPEKYTADRLRSMKLEHSINVNNRMNAHSDRRHVLASPTFVSIIDREINRSLDVLSKCQFYPEFDLEYRTNLFAQNILSGEYASGTAYLKSVALHDCARYISIKCPTSETARTYLENARPLSARSSIVLTQAYLLPATSLDSKILEPILYDRSPATLSAILRLLRLRFGASKAIDWMTNTGIEATDLTAIGKLVLLKSQLDLENWDAAHLTVRTISRDDTDSLPLLNHLVGLSHLLRAVPEELKSPILITVPINASTFPLAADQDSVNSMTKAITYFASAASLARDLGCPRSAQLSCQYALWLKLLLPDTKAMTKETLSVRFATAAVPLHLVSLALEFGISINPETVERQLEQEIALTGTVSLEATTARLALATLHKSPDDFVDYIDSYYDNLAIYMQPKFLRFNQIYVLAVHGRKRRALEYLEALLESSIEVSRSEQAYLTGLIEKADTSTSTLLELEQYNKTNSIDDLRLAVYALQQDQKWDDLYHYAKRLFHRTRSIEDAEIFAQALRNSNRSTELTELIQSHSFIVEQSWNLRLLSCWTLLDQGRLRAARRLFLELERRNSDPNYRELEVMTCVITGHWQSLQQFLANQLQHSAKRSADELLKAAALAEDLESPHARELISAAAAAGRSDPQILVGAFQLATRGGWEADHGPAEWINRARQLSDEHGPIRSIDIDEFISQIPKWQRQRSHITHLISKAQIPISAGAEFLHHALSDFILVPAFSNLEVNSAHQLTAVPIYSGASTTHTVSLSSTIGFDVTSLLVLEFLDLLPTVLSSFDSIVLPPRIMQVLLSERSLAKFHQPSRVANGRELQDLVVSGKLIVLDPSSTIDGDLASEVGDELAMLIAEAERVPVQPSGRRLVVRPSPVQKVWVEDRSIVDLTSHRDVLCSCSAVVTNLNIRGYLTAAEFAAATSYLRENEEDWPDQPDVANGAELFLDSRAVSRFLHLELMGTICSAGFRVFVSRQLISEFNSITTRAQMLSKVRFLIDNIRSRIVAGIDQGTVRVGRDAENNRWSDQLKSLQTVEGLISMAKNCDVIVCDDRFFNQKEYFSINSGRVAIISTISVIESLCVESKIQESERLSSYTKLRRSGFSFVPVGTTELATYISNMCSVRNREFESAELRAIRVSLLLARTSSVFNAESEFRWLDSVFETFIRVVQAEWLRGGKISDLRCRSTWIGKQLDMRGWAHKLEGARAIEVSRLLYLGVVPMLFVRPAVLGKDLIDEYWRWVEHTFLSEIKLKAPSAYEELVKQHRSQIRMIVEDQVDEFREQFGDHPDLVSEMARIVLEYSAPLIRKSLLEDEEYVNSYGSSVHPVILLHPGRIKFRRDFLFDAARCALKDARPVSVDDIAGNTWTLKVELDSGDVPSCAVRRGDEIAIVPNPFALSENRRVRSSCFLHMADQLGLPLEASKSWETQLQESSLNDSEMVELVQDFRDTIGYVSAVIDNEFRKDRGNVEALIPASVRYYNRLVGTYRGEDDVSDYAAKSGAVFLGQLTRIQSRESLSAALVVGADSQLTQRISVEGVRKSDLESVMSWVVRSGDRISQIAALEVGIRIVSRHPWIQEYLISLLEILRTDDCSDENSGFAIQSALFAFVYSELSHRCIMTEVPPFYTRIAALAHSSIIYRCLIRSNVDRVSFCERLRSMFLYKFGIQSLVHMRMDPQTEAVFFSASHLRAQFLSRAVAAGCSLSDTVTLSPLRSLLLGDHADSLRSQIEFPYWFVGGLWQSLPVQIVGSRSGLASVVWDQLSSEDVSPDSFVALINSAFIGAVEFSHSDLASETLSRGRYRLCGVEGKSELLSVLVGLARVAAHSRNSRLARAVQRICHNYRYDRQFPLSTGDEFEIMLVAGASLAELDEWCEFVGEWLVDLALSPSVAGQSRHHLYRSVRILTGIVPELWMSCGAADAALWNEYESDSN